jgi:hypothetical protein
MRLKAGLFIALATGAVSPALIAQVNLPNAFSAGSPARAAEVNANFSALATAANDQATRIADHNSRVGTLETRATALEANLSGGNLVLAPSTATTGGILKGSNSFIHDFGTDNTFIGLGAGNFSLTGAANTAIGAYALVSATTGASNSAVGAYALSNNLTGALNTAVGKGALQNNTSGNRNTASGWSALGANTFGDFNAAMGAAAMAANTTGSLNTAMGTNTLQNNTTGTQNTAAGFSALLSNTTGPGNTSVGYLALSATTTGSANTALGWAALRRLTGGSGNTALGVGAGQDLTLGDDNILIGHAGVSSESDTIRIGSVQTRAFIAGISGTTTTGGVQVFVNGSGQLGTTTSSRRFKDDISDMAAASEVLKQLRPVTFHYRSDGERALQYGLVAEEVEKVAPGLVARAADGTPQTVYYQFLPPMLLNEYQKQQRTIETQAARIEALEQRVARLAGEHH